MDNTTQQDLRWCLNERGRVEETTCPLMIRRGRGPRKPFFFSKPFYHTWWLTRRLEVATNANINQSPGTDGFTSPPKDAVYTVWYKHLQVNTYSVCRVELSRVKILCATCKQGYSTHLHLTQFHANSFKLNQIRVNTLKPHLPVALKPLLCKCAKLIWKPLPKPVRLETTSGRLSRFKLV